MLAGLSTAMRTVGFPRGIRESLSSSFVMVPERRLIAQLERRHGDVIREIFEIEPAALTADEAQYLIGFRTADELRNRSSKARQETALRLHAKGVGGLG